MRNSAAEHYFGQETCVKIATSAAYDVRALHCCTQIAYFLTRALRRQTSFQSGKGSPSTPDAFELPYRNTDIDSVRVFPYPWLLKYSSTYVVSSITSKQILNRPIKDQNHFVLCRKRIIR